MTKAIEHILKFQALEELDLLGTQVSLNGLLMLVDYKNNRGLLNLHSLRVPDSVFKPASASTCRSTKIFTDTTCFRHLYLQMIQPELIICQEVRLLTN